MIYLLSIYQHIPVSISYKTLVPPTIQDYFSKALNTPPKYKKCKIPFIIYSINLEKNGSQ